MFEPYRYEGTVPVGAIYTTDPKIPEGKVAVEFRPPKAGEQFLSFGYPGGSAVVATKDYPFNAPRIILKDKPKRRVLVVEYDITPKITYDKYHIAEEIARDFIKDGHGRIEERD